MKTATLYGTVQIGSTSTGAFCRFACPDMTDGGIQINPRVTTTGSYTLTVKKSMGGSDPVAIVPTSITFTGPGISGPIDLTDCDTLWVECTSAGTSGEVDVVFVGKGP